MSDECEACGGSGWDPIAEGGQINCRTCEENDLLVPPMPSETAALLASTTGASRDILRRLLFDYDRRNAAYETFVRLVRMSEFEVEQVLARALKYPTLGERTLPDGSKETCDPSLPGAVDTGVYCTADHITVTLAQEAAREIEKLRKQARL